MRPITISYYSHSKDEYMPIEDMNHEHLVNVLYKSVTKGDEYLANFKVSVNRSGAFDDATLNFGLNPSFREDLVENVVSSST